MPTFQTRHRAPEFLRWAKERGGPCCLCARDGVLLARTELHHYGDKGMGQKGSDYIVCRLCVAHHQAVQGKRFIAFERSGQMDILAVMQRDNLSLLADYAAELGQGR